MITPVGTALVTALSPAAYKSQTVSVFFVSPAIGFAINGLVSPLYQSMAKADYFLLFGLIVLGAAVLIALVAKPLSRTYEGVR